jgi:hypothetical protein
MRSERAKEIEILFLRHGAWCQASVRVLDFASVSSSGRRLAATVDQTEIRRSGRHDMIDDSDLVPDF